MDIKEIMAQSGLTQNHFGALGSAISEAYAALNGLSNSVPMLGSVFLPGHRSLGSLRNVAVQHSLHLKAKETRLFQFAYAWNAINNHVFLQLKHKRVQLTAHYLGPKGNRGIRKAIYRSELQMRNGDLFAGERKRPDVHPGGEIYAQIVHGGLDKPILAAIRIPNRDYLSKKLSTFVLQIGEPSSVAVENVKDRIAETMKAKKKGRLKDQDAS
jgi:hypothetical protein